MIEKIEIDDVKFDEDGHPMQPLLNFHPNGDDQMCLTLWGWDTQESADGYTLDDITDMIASLRTAKEYLLNIDSNQGELNFEGDDDDS
jgi:hypothetical protein